MSDSGSYPLRLHHQTQTNAFSFQKHASVPAEQGTTRCDSLAYVSTSRVLDCLVAVNPAAPDRRHFLLQKCVAEQSSKKCCVTQWFRGAFFVLGTIWHRVQSQINFILIIIYYKFDCSGKQIIMGCMIKLDVFLLNCFLHFNVSAYKVAMKFDNGLFLNFCF